MPAGSPFQRLDSDAARAVHCGAREFARLAVSPANIPPHAHENRQTDHRQHRPLLLLLPTVLARMEVMPTRNAKGVNIVIYNADATAYRGIQVKT